MKHWTILKSGTALAICMTGSAAFADVTAQDVWGAWKDQMAKAGMPMSATETMSGNTLNVSNITISMDMPERERAATITLGAVDFVENGDGTVSVQLPSVWPTKMVFDVEGEGSATFMAEYRPIGMSWTVSGTPTQMSHVQSATSITLALTELTFDGEKIDLGQAEMTMNDVAYKSDMTMGATFLQSQVGSAGSLTYVVDLADPENPENRLNLRGGVNNLAFKANAQTPEGADMQNFGAALASGFGADGTFSHGGGNTHFEVTGDDQFRADTSSTGGTGRFAMDAGKLVYDLMGQGLKVDAFTSEMPLPISFEMAESAFKLVMPLSKSDALQGFELALKLGDFTMADMLWNIFDPGQTLPRDPATIGANVEAEVTPFVSLLEPDAIEEVESQGGVPGELNALTLSDLVVRAVGAEVLGEGSFTFDNTDLEIRCVSGPTPPRPPVVAYRESGEDVVHTGSVAWRLINAMSLNQMGLADDDPATGAANLRRLLTLFADPGDAAARRRIAAIRSVTCRPIVRRIRSAGGFGAARGLEVTVKVEEAAFEGSGAYLLGTVLNTFFAEYVSINRFTQTVLASVERGEIRRWPPVFGERPTL